MCAVPRDQWEMISRKLVESKVAISVASDSGDLEANRGQYLSNGSTQFDTYSPVSNRRVLG